MKPLKNNKNIKHYLGALGKNIALSDTEAQKQLEEKVARALKPLAKAQEHLEEPEHKEIDLLRTALDELRLQFALGKMEGADTLEDIEGRIENGFRSLKKSVKKTENLSKKEAKKINKSLNKRWKKLKLEINILYLRLELANENGSEKLASARKELVEDVKLVAELSKEKAEEVAGNFELWIKDAKKTVHKRALKVVIGMENYLLKTKSGDTK